MTFCKNCGAPHEVTRTSCSYCLTLYEQVVKVLYSLSWTDPRKLYGKISNL